MNVVNMECALLCDKIGKKMPVGNALFPFITKSIIRSNFKVLKNKVKKKWGRLFFFLPDFYLHNKVVKFNEYSLIFILSLC